jgi:hypothetical protein
MAAKKSTTKTSKPAPKAQKDLPPKKTPKGGSGPHGTILWGGS